MRAVLSPLGTALRRVIGDRRATSALEFAIIAPVMLLLGGGIVEVGALLRAYASVHRVAMQYALSWADCPEGVIGLAGCASELTSYTSLSSIANLAPALTPAKLDLEMVEFTMSVLNLPTVVLSNPGAALATTLSSLTASLQSVVPAGSSGVVVKVSYPYSLMFFSTLMAPVIGSTFTISYSVTQLKAPVL
jgi:Flp pilus assembly protein TadG